MKNIVQKGMKFVKDNGSTICSVLAVVGLGASAYCLIDETTKANKLLADKEELEALEKAKLLIPAYKKSIFAITTTGLLILGSNYISKKHEAALAASYTILLQRFASYRKAVKDSVGEEKAVEIQHEALKNDIPKKVEYEKEIYFDEYSQRWFHSTPLAIAEAREFMNKELLESGYLCVNAIYEKLGLEPIPNGDIIGWSRWYFEEAGFDICVGRDGCTPCMYPTIFTQKLNETDVNPEYTVFEFTYYPEIENMYWMEINNDELEYVDGLTAKRIINECGIPYEDVNERVKENIAEAEVEASQK